MKALSTVLVLMLALSPLCLGQAEGSIQIVINEVDADTPGTDVMEFVELYDGGVGNTLLVGYVLVFFNGSSDTSYLAVDLTGSTDSNGFYLLGSVNVPGTQQTLGGVFPDDDNLIQNGADAVALYVDSAANFPNGTAVTATNIVDALVYDTNDSDDTGLLSVLTPGEPQINEDGMGNKDTESNSRCPDGGSPLVTTTYAQGLASPGALNNCTFFDHDIACTPNGPDVNVTFSVVNGTPGNSVFIAATSVNPNQAPFGWFFGVNMTIGELQAELNTGNPWVGVLDVSGNYTFVFPVLGATCPIFAGTLPLDTVAIEYTVTTIIQNSLAKTINL